jgi:hypothetical protein
MRPLRLEYRTCTLRPAVAWLIDGGDAAAWIAEIARWGLDDSRCRLYVLPRSAREYSAGSVLVVTGGQIPKHAPAAASFGAIAGKVFLPVDAALLPAISDHELVSFASREALIMHPTIGAIVCERSIKVADLLRAPMELDEPFADLISVRIAHPRIEAIGFRVTESLEGMLDEMRDDIGTEPPDELAPSKDEPSGSPLANGWRKIRQRAWRAGRDLIGGSGSSGSGGGPIGKMREWIEKRIEALGSELERVRNREIHRLLEKLKDDPDEALRHALPIGGPMKRGMAPPSARLGERRTDFNLGNLRGGGPADNWNIDYELQRQLRENYVRLAERERQLGRFRRAAYVYAELLGDLASAALVLKEGNHWREAAIIYRDHLHKPLDAARCYVEARMPAEAVAIFQKERAWEELGDLQRRLGDNAAADAAFREWVTELLAYRQPLRAADVLRLKLNSREEALALLAIQWPNGSQAEECVVRLFDLHGEVGEHAAACEALTSLSAKEPRMNLVHPLLNWLSYVAKKYPDRNVRLLAEDKGRKRIAQKLAGPEIADPNQLVARLNELVSDDKLIARDVRRFIDMKRVQTVTKPMNVVPQSPGFALIGLHRDHQLPLNDVEWTNAVPGDQLIIVAGIGPNRVAACRLEFDGAMNSTEWHVMPHTVPRLIMAAPGQHLPHIFLSAYSDVPLALRVLASSPSATGGDFAAGTPTWVDGALGAAMGATAIWLLRTAPHGWTISGHRNDGAIVGQFALDATLDAEAVAKMPANWCPSIVACLADVAVAYVNMLIVFRSRVAAAPRQIVECDSTILGLVTAPRWAVPHLAVVMADRVDICWLNLSEPVVFPAVRDLETQPVAGFSTDGTLVVIAGANGWLIDGDSQGRRKVARFSWSGTQPVNVLPGPAARTFTTVERTGRVRVWKFSPEGMR